MAHGRSTALQLYTIRNETARDYAGALKKVAMMGYKGAEFFNYGEFSAKELGAMLEGLGLEAVNAHVSLDKWRPARARNWNLH